MHTTLTPPISSTDAGRTPLVWVGNRSNLRHGLHAGRLPSDAKTIERAVNRFRRRLEDEVLALRGKITITDAAFIQTAMKWEVHSQLALRWLRYEYEQLRPNGAPPLLARIRACL